MSYKIKKLQKEKAEKLNLVIKPSKNKNKKIDVFDKEGNKLASIGALGYKDYATYIQEIGLDKANIKRKNYLKRHAKEPKIKDGKRTPSFFADKILW
jgi:hypothetical protein